ncbi:tail fiber assembly protein [Pseudomonas asplenii]|uniref:tail fiber assembly protein n=1 Tax=Pseudomonas asplenii TaxID=53407 RepID=UPI0006B5150B|nr:tail fiber assembly protein [Pseudomonas fuscovaginae]
MSGYAVRVDGQGWRAVDNPNEVMADERYTTDTPSAPVPLPLVLEEVLKLTKVKRDQLLSFAANQMGPLQDAVDLEEATADEARLLKEWKQYRIALSRLEQQMGFPTDVVWPISPE